MRIATLLPSATEIVCALGLAHDIVAVTHECDYPPEIRARPVAVRPLVDAAARTSRSIRYSGSPRVSADSTAASMSRPGAAASTSGWTATGRARISGG